MIARRFIVRGRVQGVGFRYFAIRAARHAGVAGTVRNLPDGTVEAVAQGSETAISEFFEQLQRGPDFSNVSQVDEFEIPINSRYKRFEVVY
jgi:acylphosphatase